MQGCPVNPRPIGYKGRHGLVAEAGAHARGNRTRPTARHSPTEVATFDEETWYRRVFRGEDVPQLTLRAVVMGSLLGFLLAFTNLYVGPQDRLGPGRGHHGLHRLLLLVESCA